MRLKAFFFLLIFSLLCPLRHSTDAIAAPFEKRVLKVGVAVSPGIKTQPEWEAKFKKRLAYASTIFDREFKIKFEVAQIWDWELQDENHDMTYLLEHLKAHHPLEGVDIVIGLSRLDENPNSTVQDMHVVGRAQIFSGYLVFRDSFKPLLNIQHESVLTHELGHLFGAVHVNNPKSIMSPVIDRQIPTAFDSVNREIISKTRAMSFKGGADGLDSNMAGQLLSSYLQFRDSNQPAGFYYALGKFYVKLKNMPEATGSFEKALELDPQNAQFHYDLGILYSKMGNDMRAARSLSRAVALLEGPGEKSLKASALNLLGVSYFRSKDLAAAHQSWARSLTLKPDSIDVTLNLATLDLQQNQPDSAIQNLERVLNRAQGNSRVLSLLGSAYLRKGNYEQAVTYLNQALQVVKAQAGQKGSKSSSIARPADVYSNLAQAYSKMGNLSGAISNSESACHLNPTVLCYKKLGQLYLKAQDWKNVIRAMQTVLSRTKEDVDVYGILGMAYTEVKDYQKAAMAFQEGLKFAKEPKRKSELYKNLGNLYLRLKNYREAQKFLQAAIENNSANVAAYLSLAYVFLAQSQPAQAKDCLDKILRIQPNHSRAKELLDQIQKRTKKS